MSDVGEIVGRLRLDDSDWNAKLDAADAKARELGSANPKIRVQADTASALTGLTAVQAKVDAVAVAVSRLEVSNNRLASAETRAAAAERATADAAGRAARAEAELAVAQQAAAAAADRVEQSTRKVTAAQKDGQKQAVNWQGALIGGLIAVSAAAPPVAAAAVGLTGAFGAMGAAGLIGLAGIARGLKENNAVGQQYSSTVAALTADLHSLQDSSAQGLFPGVEASTSLLNNQLPQLNAQVGHFAGMLGADLPVGLDAVVTLLGRANPLFDAAGNFLGRMVQGLDNFAYSNAYNDFLTYSIQSLPEVEKFLSDTMHLVGDFIGAWAPLGTQTLPMLDGLVTGLDDIIKNTGPLVPGIIAVVGAYNLLSPVIGIVKGLTAATVALGEAEAGASAAGVGLAGGAAAVTIAGSQYLQQSAGDANYNNTYKLTKGNAKTKSAAAQAAKIDSTVAAASAGGGGMAIPGLLDQGSTNAATAGQNKIAAAERAAAAAAAAEKLATTQLAAAYNAAVPAINALYSAQIKASNAAVSEELAFDGVKDAIHGVTTAVKANGTSLDQNTAKGRANREQIAQSVQTIDAYATAQSNGGKDAAKFTQVQYTQAAALEKTMIQAGFTKKAAAEYIGELLHIPAKKATTIQLEQAAAKAKLDAFRAEWDAMQSKTISLGLFASSGSKNNNGITPAAHAYGGTVGGAGSATSDSVPAWLSRGEEVISNAYGGAAAMRPLLKAVSAGKVKTPAQAAQFLGNGAHQQVHVHITGDDSALLAMIGVHVNQGLASYDRQGDRTLKVGYMDRSLLAGPGS